LARTEHCSPAFSSNEEAVVTQLESTRLLPLLSLTFPFAGKLQNLPTAQSAVSSSAAGSSGATNNAAGSSFRQIPSADGLLRDQTRQRLRKRRGF